MEKKKKKSGHHHSASSFFVWRGLPSVEVGAARPYNRILEKAKSLAEGLRK